MNLRQLCSLDQKDVDQPQAKLYSVCIVLVYNLDLHTGQMTRTTSPCVIHIHVCTPPTNNQPLCPRHQQVSVITATPSCCQTDTGEQGSTGRLARPTQPIGPGLAGRLVWSDGWARITGHVCLAGVITLDFRVDRMWIACDASMRTSTGWPSE